MPKVKASTACVLLLFCGSLLRAQDSFPIPDASVGVPYSFDFYGGFDFSELQALFAEIGATFTFTVTATNVPPGLTFDSNGHLSGTPTTPGTFNLTITERFLLIYMGQTIVDEPTTLVVTLLVRGATGPPVSIDPGGLTFPFNQGSTTPVSQSIVVSNRGAQAQSLTVNATTSIPASWLSVSGGGSVGPFSSAGIPVTVNPSGLPAGTYVGNIAISATPSNQSANVTVVVTVNSGQKQIQLSQTGLRFQTVSGGGAPQSQTISVLNGGAGSLAFSASASTVSGGGWLSVSPASGSATSASAASVTVSVNPTGLQAGDYYGTIQVASSGVDNSPQTASVVLNVAAAGTTIGAFLQRTGLIFVGSAGGAKPAAQTISITNPSSTPLNFASSLFFGTTTNWFTVQPASGSVSSTAPATITVQPDLTGVTPGIYTGDLTLYFTPGNSIRHVQVVLIVLPAGSIASPAINAGTPPPAAGCTATKLLPVFTQLGAGFGTVAAWPTPIEATVVDDCGAIMTQGNVVASFSSGDPALSLRSLVDGRWTATWQPRSSATQVTITAKAQQTAPPLTGTQSIGGALTANPVTPVISAGGVVSAAKFAPNQPLAPGSFASIYGSHLSNGINQSTTAPYATQLGATQVIMGGRNLPLQFTAEGQINAIIPYDVAPNSTQQIIVMNGPAISVPEPIIIATAQPAVFTDAGTAIGKIVAVKPDGTFFVVDANHPASAGDVALIYCAGLGPVDPPVPAGTAAPGNTLSRTVNTVTATIGGKDAAVAFAGLTPGFVGLYQVNATVPSGVTPGAEVPVVITAASLPSVTVTIAIK
jgi:uncharacterized protein (TIGR03437 family)